MTSKPRELPRRRYRIELTDELAGFHVTMGAMWGRELIRIRREELDEADILDLLVDRCIEHDFPVDDLRDLDYWMLEAIMDGWKEAMAAAAVPPPSATGSVAASLPR